MKRISTLSKGKKRVGSNAYGSSNELQAKLKANEYIIYWRVADEETVYIDKENVIFRQMTEKTFDKYDKAKFTRSL